MKIVIVWRALCACSLLSAMHRILLASSLLCIAAPLTSFGNGIYTPPQWTAAVAAYNGTTFVPLVSTSTTPDSDQYAWAGYQWIESYVALAQTTGSSTYMDTAKQIIDWMFANRDDVRFPGLTLTPGYYSAPSYLLYNYYTTPQQTPVAAVGWRRLNGGNYSVGPLIDGRICEAILMWCELARHHFPQYESAISGYLPKIKETIDMELPSMFNVPTSPTVPAGHFYTPTLSAKSFKYWRDISQGIPGPTATVWSGFIPVNQTATFARAMMGYNHLTGTTLYRDQVQAVVNHYLNALDTTRPAIAAWMYSPLDAGLGSIEDVNHATITLSLIEEAYRCGGYGVTGDHIVRLCESFDTFYDAASKGTHNYVDGTGSIITSGVQVYSLGWKSWLWLSQFDPTIATRVRDTYNTYFASTDPAKNSTKINDSQCFAGWADLIYWENHLAGTAAFDDSTIGPPGPSGSTARLLYTDSTNRLLYPYCVQTTVSELTSGSPEGTKHMKIDYTITSGTGSCSALWSFSPSQDITPYNGIRLTYRNTGPAVWSLLLMDGTNAMTAPLPTQSSYTTVFLPWSAFSNAAAVSKTAISKIRFSNTGTPVGSTGTFEFDDIQLY